MSMLPNSQEARDVAYQLHPYTNARAHQQDGPLVIERGEGPYVFDASGKRYFEAMAGLWSVGLGFNEKRLVDAAHKQMLALPFYHTFSAKSHGPSIDLAEKLVALAPVPMSKVFFTNSGSEANDTVLKLIAYRSNALGLPLPNILHTGSPHFYKDGAPGESEEAFATRRAEELDALIQKEGPDTIAAFFGEPVMGAGGVIVPPATYWDKIQKVLNKYDILLVADEVICGFGRTGKMFGCETYGIKPDVLVVSKQITSSYFPLSAIMMNDRMFEPIADESNKIGVLGHGFTAGGHPVGSAIALENLKIIEERGLVAHAAELGGYMQGKLRELAAHPLVGEVRGVGMIAALELVLDKQRKTAAATPGAVGGMASRMLQERGVISRNMLDAIAICPPLIVTKAQVDELVAAIKGVLDDMKGEAAKLTPA